MRTNTTIVLGTVAVLSSALFLIRTNSKAPQAKTVQPDRAGIARWTELASDRAFADTVSAEQSIEILQKAVDAIYWHDTLPSNGKLYMWLGYALKRGGYYHAAANWYDAAIAVHERYGAVHEDPSSCLYKPAANIYTRRGDNQKAERLLRTAIDSSRSVANLIENHYELALVYANMDRDSLALRHFNQALQKLDAGDEKALATMLYPEDVAFWQSLVLQGMAQSAVNLPGQPALTQARRAMDEAQRARIGREEIIAGAHNTLGTVYAAEKNYPLAERSFREALALLPDQQQTLRRERAKIRLDLARVQRSQQRFGDALQGCQAAIADVLPGYRWNSSADQPALSDFYPENVLLEAQELKGEIYWKSYAADHRPESLNHAIESLQLACAAADSLRACQQYEDARMLALAVEYPATELLIAACYEQQSTFGDSSAAERAFALAERKKAVTLLGKRSFELELQRADPQESRRYHGLLESLRRAMTEAKLQPDDPTLALRIGRLREEIYQLEAGFRGKSSAAAPLRPITAATLRERLAADPGQVLLEYFYSPTYQTLYGWTVTPAGIQFKKLPYAAAAVRAYSQSLAGGAASLAEYVRQSRDVYESVVAPLLPAGTSERLVVIPDGPLTGIPFEALLDRDVYDSADYATLPYLLRRFRVRMSPSATLSFSSTQNNDRDRAYASSYLGVAPFYSGYQGWLDTVKHSQPCIQAVQASFTRPTVLVGPAATVDAFKAAAPEYDIIQFYGHAGTSLADCQSRMAFTCTTPVSRPIAGVHQAGRESGMLDFSALPPEYAESLLTEAEILTLQLRARLVMLSACETGAGDYQVGEGIMSLGRGFLYAGASSTVLSLWKLNDKSTSVITQTFFTGLAQGLDKDEALRQSKLKFLETMAAGTPEERRMTQPHYWAAMVLVGDNAPILPGKRSFFERMIAALGVEI